MLLLCLFILRTGVVKGNLETDLLGLNTSRTFPVLTLFTRMLRFFNPYRHKNTSTYTAIIRIKIAAVYYKLPIVKWKQFVLTGIFIRTF